MNNKHLPIILIVILLQLGFLTFFLQPVNAQEKIKERVVTDVVISGNRTVSTDTILLKIKTAIGRKLIQKQLNEDIKRLYATGFFTDVGVELEDYKEGARVIFSVTEKAVIKKIIFQGNESITEARLKKEIETKLEDVLSKRVLASDVKKLKAY